MLARGLCLPGARNVHVMSTIMPVYLGLESEKGTSGTTA